MWLDPESGIAVWTVKHFGHRPYLLNQERKDDRHKRAKVVAYWRESFALEAMGSDLPRPLPGPVHISVAVYLMHGWKQDVGACFPTAKAAIDGLVDAGFLPHDGPEWVSTLSFIAPKLHQPQNGIELHVCLASPPTPERNRAPCLPCLPRTGGLMLPAKEWTQTPSSPKGGKETSTRNKPQKPEPYVQGVLFDPSVYETTCTRSTESGEDSESERGGLCE